jgi:D-glycero-alpha-D-manno-heptose 1-phosphate guanylyltransferase
MEAIILAGGFGTRLRSVVSDVPKPMAPIGQRPFLELLMDRLIDAGFDHLVLSTGYLHEKIEEHFGNAYRNVPISYAVEHEPLGTGGGIRNAMTQCHGDEVVVLNGDTLFKVDYSNLLNFFHSHPTRLSVILRQVDDTSRYGSVQTDCCDRIVRFAEKATSHGFGSINGGIYMMHRSLVDEMPAGMPFSFERDIMQAKYMEEPFYAYISGDYFLDIGVPDDYLKLCREYQH